MHSWLCWISRKSHPNLQTPHTQDLTGGRLTWYQISGKSWLYLQRSAKCSPISNSSLVPTTISYSANASITALSPSKHQDQCFWDDDKLHQSSKFAFRLQEGKNIAFFDWTLKSVPYPDCRVPPPAAQLSQTCGWALWRPQGQTLIKHQFPAFSAS